MRPPSRPPSGPGPLSWLLILLVIAVAAALPLLGAWVASSLAAHAGAQRKWMIITAGLLPLFVLPVAWELLALPRRRPDGTRPRRRLRLGTRLVLRAWAVNLALLTGALLLSPRGVFTALSTRGDWMLPPRGGMPVELTRRLLFATAEKFEWAYVLASKNPYRDQLIAKASEHPPPAPYPTKKSQEPLEDDSDVVISWKTEPKPPNPSGDASRGSSEQTPPRAVGRRAHYPLPAQLHSRVASIPSSVETDYTSVAQYLVSGVLNPFERIKALHDYVAERVGYDLVAYHTMNYPPQTPEEVFRTRKAVCSGYSNLFAAMGKAVGEEIVTISGESLEPAEEGMSSAHAWNAVHIEGDWYFVDVTWDSTNTYGAKSQLGPMSIFLFMPPQQFLETHFPADPAWQLMDPPLSRGEALRLPKTGPPELTLPLGAVRPISH